MDPEICGLVGHQGVAGRVRFAEAVPVKAHYHLPDILYHLKGDTALTGPLDESGMEVPELLFPMLFADHLPQGIGFGGIKPGQVYGCLAQLLLKDHDAQGLLEDRHQEGVRCIPGLAVESGHPCAYALV